MTELFVQGVYGNGDTQHLYKAEGSDLAIYTHTDGHISLIDKSYGWPNCGVAFRAAEGGPWVYTGDLLLGVGGVLEFDNLRIV